MLTEKDSEWVKLQDRLYEAEGMLNARQYSVWWKDISVFDVGSQGKQCWFNDSVRLKLGNGGQSRLWLNRWCGPRTLMEVFPTLFAISAQQNNTVEAAGGWNGNRWRWKLS